MSRENLSVESVGGGPLAGAVVLDLTRYLPGAVTTLWLASFGAEVIKIERPGSGDPGRQRKQLFAATNRGKKSLALDLKAEPGRRLLKRLAARADVLVENFRPGVLQRLGLDYEGLGNRRLVCASLTGYGARDGWATAAGHDINYSALAGLLDLVTPTGTRLPEVPIADVAGGAFPLLVGILLALLARKASGRGGRVDVAILPSLSSLLAWPLSAGCGAEAGLDGGLLAGDYACYGVYYAKCGRRLAVGALEPKFWANLCRKLGCEELMEGQFASAAQQVRMRRRLAEIFRTRSARAWMQRLQGRDCCVSPVRTLAESRWKQPVAELGVRLEGGGAAAMTAAPGLGRDSAKILARIGVSKADLSELAQTGVVQTA